MSDSAAPVREGDVLAGKYVVERVLGVGGMGVVVQAHHTQLDERVAIKFLLAGALGKPEAVARFAREARAAVKIKGEHVARVIDVGTLETGAPYMVMEFLQGGDLEALLRSHGPLPIEDAVEYVLQASEAIAEAHSLGIVHRDLKPANLFLIRRPDGSPSVKVLDFGISKSSFGGSSDAALTRTAAVMGSPLYMSPEQLASSKDVDGRTDIWALAAILHELLSGKTPFTGETLPELCLCIVQQPPPPLRSLRADVPPGLEAVILRCLEKDRDRRYANVAELAVALAEFGPKRARTSAERALRIIQGAGMSSSAMALPPSSADRPVAAADTAMSSWGNTSAPSSKSGARLLAIAAAALVAVAALAAGGVWALRKTPANDAATSLTTSTGSATPPVSAATPEPNQAPTPDSSAVAQPDGGTPPDGATDKSSAVSKPGAKSPSKKGEKAEPVAKKAEPASAETKPAPPTPPPPPKPDNLGGRL